MDRRCDEPELTYGEHVECSNRVTKGEYSKAIEPIIRNLIMSSKDYDPDSFLTESFFKREDISNIKKEKLKDLTNYYKSLMLSVD